MKYSPELIDVLKLHKKIIVSGPQRSGTRAITNFLAKDLDYCFIDEMKFDAHDTVKFIRILNSKNEFVCQAPGQCHMLHTLDLDSCIVVLCRRNVDDIILSQNRINWKYEYIEFEHYKQYSKDIPISILKYKYWDEVQIKQMKVDFIEVDYESFKIHPEWVKKPNRLNFESLQIKEK